LCSLILAVINRYIKNLITYQVPKSDNVFTAWVLFKNFDFFGCIYKIFIAVSLVDFFDSLRPGEIALKDLGERGVAALL